jgi:predicted CXXCH cytochrome family protein
MVKFRSPISALAVVTVLIGSAFAGKHPVPLEKGVKETQCLECHEEKTKGAHVHTAVTMGCFSCHEVRVNKDVTRIKLVKNTNTTLCLSCHDNKQAVDGQTMHKPAARECIKCHDPHMSANTNQLIKPTSGSSKEDNLCLTCHTEGTNVPKEGSRHAALDMGCETCHVTHKNGPRGQQEFDYHLKSAVPKLCVECHDPADANLQKAHQNQPFGTANCTQCHNPHQSNSPKLMQAFTHNPFENKMCDTCHQPAKDGKVVLTQTDVRSICITCHGEQAEKIEKAKVQHPGAQGDCTACHNPHAGKTPGFLQPDPVKACLACHSTQAEDMKKAHLHQPAYEMGCATCHTPHGGDNEHLLRVNRINSLCLECHSPDAKAQKLESEHLETIFNGTAKLPSGYVNSVIKLPIKYGRGHPIENHPIQDQMDPSDVTKVKAQINCLSCHESHAATQAGMLVKDQVNNMQFCASCHKDLGH